MNTIHFAFPKGNVKRGTKGKYKTEDRNQSIAIFLVANI